jgi:four helix bundle protein
MSYRKLEIWQESRDLVIKIHWMTLHELPTFEMYEEGSQIRRSMKSVKSNIVEGYGRKHYHQDFIRFTIYALASCDETIDHLENLFETKSLKNPSLFDELHSSLTQLGKKIYHFLQFMEESRDNLSVKESAETYGIDTIRFSRYEAPQPVTSNP